MSVSVCLHSDIVKLFKPRFYDCFDILGLHHFTHKNSCNFSFSPSLSLRFSLYFPLTFTWNTVSDLKNAILSSFIWSHLLFFSQTFPFNAYKFFNEFRTVTFFCVLYYLVFVKCTSFFFHSFSTPFSWCISFTRFLFRPLVYCCWCCSATAHFLSPKSLLSTSVTCHYRIAHGT